MKNKASTDASTSNLQYDLQNVGNLDESLDIMDSFNSPITNTFALDQRVYDSSTKTDIKNDYNLNLELSGGSSFSGELPKPQNPVLTSGNETKPVDGLAGENTGLYAAIGGVIFLVIFLISRKRKG